MTNQLSRRIYVLGKQGVISRVSIEPNGKTADGKTARIYRHITRDYDATKYNAPMYAMLVIADLAEAMATTEAFAGAKVSLVTLDRVAWIARMGYANIVKRNLSVDKAVEETVLANIRSAEARESDARWSEDYVACIKELFTSFVGLKAKGIAFSFFDVHDNNDKARMYGHDVDKESSYVVVHNAQTKEDIKYTWSFCPETPVLEIGEEEDALAI